MEDYDEDLSLNPFFIALQQNQGLFKQVAENLWIICVPCKPSLEDVELNLDLIQTHILVPSSSGAKVLFFLKKRQKEIKIMS
mgnify:CR=1 FL=1